MHGFLGIRLIRGDFELRGRTRSRGFREYLNSYLFGVGPLLVPLMLVLLVATPELSVVFL